jgi:hypothetical protein
MRRTSSQVRNGSPLECTTTVALVSCSKRLRASSRHVFVRTAKTISFPFADHSISAFSDDSFPGGNASTSSFDVARSHNTGSKVSPFKRKKASRLLSGDHLNPRTCCFAGSRRCDLPVAVSMIETSDTDGAV